MTSTLGQIVHSFFEDHLKVQRGLRPGSIRSYRTQCGCSCTSLRRGPPSDYPAGTGGSLLRANLAFLKDLEEARGNHIRTRNQRLAALRTFFNYLAAVSPRCSTPASGLPRSRSSVLRHQRLIS